MAEAPLVEREEIVALLFNVSDVAVTLRRLVLLVERDDAKKRRLTKEDHAFLHQMLVNAEPTRKLAEKAQAELDRRNQPGAAAT